MVYPNRLTYINSVSELSAAEKDRVLELLLDRLGVDLMAYKFDGESERVVQLVTREKR